MAKKTVDEAQFVPVYDSYLPDDFKYGEKTSTNLNPRRETPVQKRDVLKKIEVRLQEITDDMVRKQVALRPPVDRLRGGVGGGEALPLGMPLAKRAAIRATGGLNNALLFPSITPGMNVSIIDKDLEFIIGTFPGRLVDELDMPPELDCDAILSEFFGIEGLKPDDFPSRNPLDDFKDRAGLHDLDDLPESDEESDDDDENDDDDGGDDSFDEDDDGDDQGDDSDDYDDYDDEYKDKGVKECAQIELGWLKIILVIAKIIKILKKIIDLVLAILMPIIEIIMLAAGCWINPVNLAKIAQLIIQLIIALIVMIITMIIQLIWDLLNLDCITDSTQDVIDEIAKCLAAFASVVSAFNPNAVAMMLKDFNDKIMDPLAGVAAQMKENAQGWAEMKDQVKALFTDPSVIQGVINEIGAGVVAGVKSENADKIGKVGGIVADAKDLFDKDGSLGKVIKAFNSYKDTRRLKQQAKRTSKTADGIVQSLQFVGTAFSEKEE